MSDNVAVAEICTTKDGTVLWVENYVFSRMNGIGSTFIRDWKEYRVVAAKFTQGAYRGGLVEHVVELIADRTPLTVTIAPTEGER